MDFGGGTISHSPNGITNGASKDEICPLNVTIVGAGIGGLTAAIFLRQQGHIVTLLEQSRFANELGAAVHLAPNANGLLRRIGLKPEDQGAVETKWLTQWTPDGKELFTVDLASQAHKWQHPWQLAHRVNLHSELKRLATTEKGAGTPVVLRTRCRVVHVDTKEGTVTLEDGEKVYGDLVVGADGVHSKTRKHIPGAENIETFGSGKSAFRFLIPKERALADSETRKYVEREGHLHMVFGRDRRVVIYPTSNNTLLNFVNIHPTAESQTQSNAPSGGFWQSQGNISKMLEIYKDFEPAVLKLLSLADEETLKVWELIDMAQLPTWTEGKLVLIGDAAHPFTPHQGQGAGQAIEDATSLAVMLHRNTPMSSIPSRLKLYEKCRYERASRIQEYSRIAGKDLGTGPPIDTTQFTNYNFGHDEWDYSMQALRKWEWTQKKGLLWRMPVSFGPMPGPRQDFEGWPRDGSTATFATTSIKFKTSRTVLENLFPTEKLRFASADTVACATLSHTRLDRLQWLGGRGYSHFGLYIHGVQYSKDNGETMRGSYLPVLFENLADPILSGREELGFPKLFCDLDLQTGGPSWSLEASWMSAKFCTVKLAGLQDSATINGVEHSRDTNAAKDEGLFFSKYIPTTGSQGSKERGQADVEYMAFLPEEAGTSGLERKVVRTLRAQNAEILFDALDWEALPTLHHIVQRLKEIPVYEIVEAKLEEGTGMSDVNGAHKLD